MVARVASAALVGVDATPVTVEVETVRRLPCVSTVGLATRAVKESDDRVRSAVKACGIEWPQKRVIINLAPADLPKAGTGFDLPIAVGVLAAIDEIKGARAGEFMMLGELALDGQLRGIPGVLAASLAAREAGYNGVVVPRTNGQEATLVDGLEVHAADDLTSVIAFLNGKIEADVPTALPPPRDITSEILDMEDVRGLQGARRALEVAAAGGHNILFSGSPGTGKSMLAQRLPSILPPLTRPEALDVTRIHSVGGLLAQGGLVRSRPFRSPHHTITQQALVGGGVPIRPGEITLAHRGVLYLDELPEFPRSVVEVLRQPLEDRVVTVARATQRVCFPADFQLIATANPCPCGYHGDEKRPCHCNPMQIQRYQERMSGPLLDRIDLFVEVVRLAYDELSAEEKGESSAVVRQRVRAARERQLFRLSERPAGLRTNARLTRRDLDRFVKLGGASRLMLKEAVDSGLLSPRAHDRVLRVARTLADLVGRETPADEDVAEAIALRVDAFPQGAER